VVEHVDDPVELLRDMEAAADRVLVNFLEDDEEEDNPLHRSLEIGRMLRYAMRRRVVSYRIHHGRSHLVLYESGPPRRLPSLASARVVAGTVRRGDAPATFLPIPWSLRPWRRWT
jgi:hypothetical protein